MANLQRQIRKPRYILGNGAKFGRALPFSYHYVFAGESQHNIKTQMTFMSKPLAPAMSGCTVDIWYYYVPFRLLWNDFPQWVMGDSTLTPPTTNNAAGEALFGTGVGAYQGHFLATAYETIVNHYYREEHDQFQLSGGTMAVLPIVDRTAETQGDEDYEEEDETIDVSGGTLSLKELSQKRAKLAYERRVESLDGKYTSWLRMQGVNANEAVAQVPEFLGHYRKYIRAQKTVNDGTGATVQHYHHECTHTLSKRRFFQEHGVVIGIASMRPKVILKGGKLAEGTIWFDPSHFPHVGQLAEMKKIQNTSFESLGGAENETDHLPATYLNIDHYLWNGRMISMRGADGYFTTYDPTDDETALYPSAAWDAVTSAAADEHYHIDGVMSTKVATPLRRLKVM